MLLTQQIIFAFDAIAEVKILNPASSD